MEKETKNKKTTTSTSKKTASKKTTTTSKKTTGAKKTSTTTAKKKAATKATVKTEAKPKEEVVKVENKKAVVKTVEEKSEPKVITKKETSKDIKMFLNSEIGTLIKIVLIIAGVVLVFLLITNIINSYKEKNENLVTSNDIQYDEILVSNILNQKKSSYYVLVYDAKDLYYETYNLYLTSYKGKDDALRVYTSVLSSGFNRNYYTEEESNVIVSNIEDLKFEGTTLVKVENGAIVSAYEDSASIIEHLKSIVD